MKAFILAAGLGTRLKPLTNNIPKALVKLNGITLLERQILNLKKYGFDEIVINVHYLSNKIIDFLKEKNNFGLKIHISDETEKLLDTGGAIKKAIKFFDKPFLVHNTDIITDLDLSFFYEYHKKKKALVTLAVRKRKANRVLCFDENGFLCCWKNKKENKIIFARKCNNYTEYAFSGIHIIDPKITEFFPKIDKFGIIDIYLKAAAKNKITFYDHSKDFWFDVGTPENLKSAEKFLISFLR